MTPKDRHDGDELATDGPDFKPLDIIHAKRFSPSRFAEEVQPCLCDYEMQGLVETVCEHSAAEMASSKAYTQALEVCKNADGLIVDNPLLEHLGREQDRLSKPYWQALDVLTFAVEAHVLNVVIDALEIAGITEAQTVKEIARCAMRGGQMWDGGGFTKPGETPKPPRDSKHDGTLKQPDGGQGVGCPHCGNEIAFDATRCCFCERRIG